MDTECLVSLEGLANSGSVQLRGCGQMELIGVAMPMKDRRMLMLETEEPSAVSVHSSTHRPHPTKSLNQCSVL